MTVTVEQFRTRFPQFTDPPYSDAQIQLALDDALCYIGEDNGHWCGCYDQAHAYVAAHLLTLASKAEAGDSGGNAGPILSKTAGGVSVTREGTGSTSPGNAFWASTGYGQMYLSIRNRCMPNVLVANCI